MGKIRKHSFLVSRSLENCGKERFSNILSWLFWCVLRREVGASDIEMVLSQFLLVGSVYFSSPLGYIALLDSTFNFHQNQNRRTRIRFIRWSVCQTLPIIKTDEPRKWKSRR